jgi:cation:H+ antiporter
VSAIVAGRVSMGREGLWLTGGTSLAMGAVVLALALGGMAPGWSLLLTVLVLTPYVAVLALRPAQIAALRLPTRARHFIGVAVGHAHRDARQRRLLRHPAWQDGAWLAVALALVVVSSLGAVRSAVWLGGHWGVGHAVIGMLMLAALTSVPNVVAAVKLAREGRGAVVVSESLNSNTLNIVAGLCLPAVVLGFGPPTGTVVFAALWLLAMKLVALGAASRRHGLRRGGGILLVALYLVFAAAIVARG